MFAKKATIPLFPTPLWVFNVPEPVFTRINSELRKKFDELIAAVPELDDNDFYQSAHDLHTLPEMQELNRYFVDAVDEVLNALSPRHKEVQFTGCWANIHPSNMDHGVHTHPNNFLSAVYYVTVPPGGARIMFYDPRVQQYVLTPAKSHAEANTEHTYFEVEEGMLLLFPSWLAHSVPPSNRSDRRISISFNINFSNFTEQVSPPMWEPNLPTHPRSA